MASPVMILKLMRLESGEVLVDIVKSPAGESHGKFTPPYSKPHQSQAVALALEAVTFERPHWEKVPDKFQALKDLQLGDEHDFKADLPERVGRTLYEALFPPGGMREALHAALNAASDQEPARVELRFDANATDLGAYPWELLCDDPRGFLFAGRRAALIRYVTCELPRPKLLEADTLNVLLVTARPISKPTDPGVLLPLPDYESKVIEDSLGDLTEQGRVQLKHLPPASSTHSTAEQLSEHLIKHQGERAPHVFHFDGHGDFGRRCPPAPEGCGTLNRANAAICGNSECQHRLNGEPQGYLAFERRDKRPHWISAQELSILLAGVGVRLAVLTACKSAVVAGESVFGGMGPALIQAGVPAVVAMQFSITAPAAMQFTKLFYLSLGQRHPLTLAMGQARAALFTEPTAWYRPVLYLRTDDDNPEGRLFRVDMAAQFEELFKQASHLPGAQEVLAPARKSLEYNCQEIKSMSEYKNTHDLLQRVEGSYRSLYDQLYNESGVLIPLQQRSWRSTASSRSALQTSILKLSDYVVTTSFSANAHEWLENLRQASHNLQAAYDGKDQQLLEDAVYAIDDVIGSQTWLINERLIGTIDALHLSDLVHELENVYERVQTHRDGSAAHELGEFEGAIAEFGKMSDRLTACRQEHDAWQQLDNRLRIEQQRMLVGLNVGRFRRDWEKSLRKKMLALCTPLETDWAQDLISRIDKLDAALGKNSPSDEIRDAFFECRSAATNRFVRVNHDLKTLCNELTEARRPLEVALERLPDE